MDAWLWIADVLCLLTTRALCIRKSTRVGIVVNYRGTDSLPQASLNWSFKLNLGPRWTEGSSNTRHAIQIAVQLQHGIHEATMRK